MMPLPKRPLFAALALASVAVSASACKTLSADPTQPDYASDAETNMKEGNEALESKNFLEAERYFEHVRGKYPFLEAAKEAELKLADTDFDRDQFVEARDRYQSFVKLHPTHPKVDYAAFRAALTHYKEIPSDFFMLPPSKEKDQAALRLTLTAMNDFVRIYPKSGFAEEARGLVADSRKRLAEHELYVAAFYRKREKWTAVAGRLQNVVQKYPGVGYDEEAYFGLVEAYRKMNDQPKAQETLKTIVEKLPGTRAAERARSMLGTGG